MKKIVLLLRQPFLDRIPSLKSLINFLSENGFEILIITSKDHKFPELSFSCGDNLTIKTVQERSKKLEIPTLIKLIFVFLKELFSRRPCYIMGGDMQSNILSCLLSFLFRIKHINFQLEYPQIFEFDKEKFTFFSKMEHFAIKRAYFIITHDQWHSHFLIKHLNLNEKKILTLPNSPPDTIKNTEPHFLHKILGINIDTKIILHSGGFGNMFNCRELASQAKYWPSDYKLVFHLSHSLDGDPYFSEVFSKNDSKVLFSTQPVSTNELDSLVSSAYIGIALYSELILKYRATFMGLAAGKIGNYLKCGIPVIATKLISLSYLTDYKCGILISNESEIQSAIKIISDNYKEYSHSARKCYDELWHPKPYLEKIHKSLIE